MKNKKTIIAIISVVALLLVLIGVTYAYWLVTKIQTNSNIISSACLDITLDNESAAINLGSQYPMSDEDGMKLTPYTFTVTNNCNTSIDYQVALESIGTESTAIKSKAIKVALDNNIRLLSAGGTLAPTISGAYAAHRLGMGRLTATGTEGSNATHSLRLWIDENASISEANKAFQSKISVTIGQEIQNPYEEGTLAFDIIANNNLNTEKIDFSVPATDTNRNIYKAEDDIGDSYYFRGAATNNYVQFGKYIAGTYLGTTTYYGSPYYYYLEHPEGGEPTPVGPFFSLEDCEAEALKESATCSPDGEMGEFEIPIYVKETTPLYWRIVRINGDGTIRLAFDGTEKAHNGVFHNLSIVSSSYSDDVYYASELDYGSSVVKDKVDTWYVTHLKANYEDYIADGIFCNDREVSRTFDTGYDEAGVIFASYKRLNENKSAKLTCTRSEDRYTTTKDLGNGLLTNPIGLLNADEVMMAGAVPNLENSSFYLYSTEAYWTMTPFEHGLSEMEPLAHAYVVGSGQLMEQMSYFDPNAGGGGSVSGVRPVINLRADVEFTGDGSFETPYVIKTN